MTGNAHNLEVIWDQLAKIFNNWAGVKPNSSWMKSGLSERASAKRLRVLEGSKAAGQFYDLTKDLNQRELRYLLTRAQLNFEQAQSAGRVGTVLNGTLLIGAVVLLNQIFPGQIASFLKDVFLPPWDGNKFLILATLSLGVCLTIAILAYCYGGTAKARDLKHLIELSLARRAYYSGKRDDSSEETDLLKESVLSEL